MDPNEAQSSLDGIRHLQDRTRDEYVRHRYGRPYVLLTALGVFIALASTDVPSPWDTAVFLLGEAILVGVAIVQQRRAPVRRKANTPEVLFTTGICVAAIVLYIAFNIVTSLGVLSFGLPAPHAFAAAAIAVAVVVTAGPARRALESIVRRA